MNNTKRRASAEALQSPKRGSYTFGLFENNNDNEQNAENLTVKNHENYFYKRGLYYHFKEEDKKAREDFTKAYETDSKCIEALVGRSYLELLANQDDTQTLDIIAESFQFASNFCKQNNRNDFQILCQFGSLLIYLLKFKIRDVLLEINSLLTQIEQGDFLHIIPHEILNEISKLLQYIQRFIFQGNKYIQDLKNSTSLLSISTYRILVRFQLPSTLPENDLRNWLIDMIMNNYSHNLFLKNSSIRLYQQSKYAEMNFCDLIFKFLSFKESQMWWPSIVRWAIKNERLSLTTLLLMDSVPKIEENFWIINDIVEIAFKSSTKSGNWISILRTLKPIFKDKLLIKSSDLLRAITMNHYDLTNSIINLYPQLINSKVDEFYTISPYSKTVSTKSIKSGYNSQGSSYFSGSDHNEIDDFDIIQPHEDLFNQKKFQKTILMYAIENGSCSIDILVLLTVQWLINMKDPAEPKSDANQNINNNIHQNNMNGNGNGNGNGNNNNGEGNKVEEKNVEKDELSLIIQFLDYLMNLDDDLASIHRIATFVSILRRNPHWFMDSNIDTYHRKVCKKFIKECSNWQKKINLKLINDFYDDFSTKDIISSALIPELIDRFIVIDDQFDTNQWCQAEMVIAWIINFVSSNSTLYTANQFQYLLLAFREAYKFISYEFKKKGEFKGGDLSHYRKYEYIKGIEFQLANFL